MKASNNMNSIWEDDTQQLSTLTVPKPNSENISFVSASALYFLKRRVGGLSPQALEFVTKVKGFAKLTHNWDGYGAVPPSEDTVNRVVQFIQHADSKAFPFYFTAPGPNGEISLEFKKGEVSIEVFFNEDASTELIVEKGAAIVLESTLAETPIDTLSTFLND